MTQRETIEETAAAILKSLWNINTWQQRMKGILLKETSSKQWGLVRGTEGMATDAALTATHAVLSPAELSSTQT